MPLGEVDPARSLFPGWTPNWRECWGAQEEIAVAPGKDELVLGWLAQGEAAQYERPGIVADLLRAVFSLVPYELNGFQLLQSLPGNANMRKQ
jgi:hypothetical protein